MATEKHQPMKSTANNKNNKGKQRYLPQYKPVKKKGSYPLRPGVQGFFITCDGGRERQGSLEAINVLDSFYEELIHGKDKSENLEELPSKPLNKKIKFTYSDDDEDKEEGEGEEEDEEEDEEEEGKEENKSDSCRNNDADNENPKKEKLVSPNVENACDKNKTEEDTADRVECGNDPESKANEAEEPPAKKQCIALSVPKCVVHENVEKSVDKLIEEELKELGDKSKRRFFSLDSGCNGVVFIQMRPRDGDPCPKDIVQHMMTSAASTRKHMSRFILRVIPIEVACYASEEEITKAIAPVVAKYFPVDTQDPQKFAVLYGARANTGIDRMKIINSVAKSVPGPHKVDLSNPDKTIVVEIVKTVCLIGVVEKYKELAKYNLRQLTTPKL